MTIAERESRNSEMVSDLIGAMDRQKMTADAATDAYSLQPAPISSAPARFKRKYRRSTAAAVAARQSGFRHGAERILISFGEDRANPILCSSEMGQCESF